MRHAPLPLRGLIWAALFGLAAGALPAAIEPAKVDFDYVRARAEAIAARPYRAPADDLPAALAGLDYDDYRNIRFKPAAALWADQDLPFRLEFFHRGGLFRDKVTVHEFSATHEQEIPFVRDFFSYDLKKDVGSLHASLGYAGFRVHTPLNRPGVYDELIAFLGASYFRAVGAHQLYGLSARGLAVDCGLPGQPEEFPRFTDFWVGKPRSGDKAITLYALLQGPSVTGAYAFVVRPGATTEVDVRAELIFRRDVRLPGFAPLTSMFWYGENSARPPGQLRPEVHDSDGLVVQDTAGRRLWRPLRDPPALEVDETPVHQLKCFGLLQRDRRFSSYEDLEAHYERRPSVWVEPEGNWGEGTVRLVQLPAGTEIGDNIVAFWVPAVRPVAGRPWRISYRLFWSLDEPDNGGLARVVSTREGDLPGVPRGRLFWVDFAGGDFAKRDAEALQAEIEAGAGGRVLRYTVTPDPDINGWRVAIQVEALQPGPAISLRCRLRDGGKPISETWVYDWKP